MSGTTGDQQVITGLQSEEDDQHRDEKSPIRCE